MFDTEIRDTPRESLAFLETMPPGILLAAALLEVDADQLSGPDRVTVLRAHDRMVAFHGAQRAKAMASLTTAEELEGCDLDRVFEAAAAEARLALHLTRRAADTELSTALDLRDRLPSVWEAWSEGLLDFRRVGVFVQGTAHLSVTEARRLAEQLVDTAMRLTTGQLRDRLLRACMEVDPGEAARRFDEAHEARRIWVDATEAGTGDLHATDLSPDRLVWVQRRINECALQLRRSGDPRTMDQLRADVFLEILEGMGALPTSGTIELRVDLDTLAGLAESPGDLAGFGPVVADIARQVASHHRDGTWTFSATDPATGTPVAGGITRRRPTTSQHRAVVAKHSTCIFPGCRMPSADCDLDHRVAFADGGPTIVENLAPLCRHDHRLRHLDGWGYARLANGDHRWTTALGRAYTTSGDPP